MAGLRHIKIPPSQIVPDARPGPDGKAPTFDFEGLIISLGSLPIWRQDDAWNCAYLEIVDAFEELKRDATERGVKVEGQILALPEEHCDKFKEAVRSMNVPATAAIPILRTTKSVLGASKAKPEPTNVPLETAPLETPAAVN